MNDLKATKHFAKVWERGDQMDGAVGEVAVVAAA